MILRRVIAHVRKQEWTAIAIDFVIAVVGVFVGIQVGNWNESRRETARGQQYPSRIGSNLAADMQSMREHYAFWKEVVAYGRAAIRYA